MRLMTQKMIKKTAAQQMKIKFATKEARTMEMIS